MKNFLDYASAKYYAGEPIISDEEFDKLAEYFNYERVGAPVALGDRVAHPFPMWSLQKCYDDEPLINLGSDDVVVTSKLDGAAVALYYVDGRLTLALTRGDGKEGLDITEKMATLVPNQLDWSALPFMQVTGEIVAPKTIDNARNYAAGALNLKSVEEFKQRDLSFIAYSLAPNNMNKFWTSDMLYLHNQGFETVWGSKTLDRFPQDGQVYRINDNEAFNNLGYTSKHPRGAFALKERKTGVITKLLGVEWQVGRSGVVSPVAILEPVVIGEATVSRATLHNIKYIRELNLEIGCLVEVVRAGEIIPRVLRRVDYE